MESAGWGPVVLGYAGMAVLVAFGLLFPRSAWARALFSSHGPSLDAGRMRRRDCWRSAFGFAVIAALGAATLAILRWLTAFVPRGWDNPLMNVLLFTYGLVTLIGLAGAIYLAVRAPFRPPEHVPVPWHEAEFLKVYVGLDGTVRTSIFAHPGGTFFVVSERQLGDVPGESVSWGPPTLIDEVDDVPTAEQLARGLTGHEAAE